MPNPRIVEHPQDGYIAKDEPASLNCRAEGEPKPEITWYRNGRKVETTPENPFSNRMIFPDGKLFFLSVVHNKKDKTDVGVYYCNATNIHGTAISRNATLSIAGKLQHSLTASSPNVTLLFRRLLKATNVYVTATSCKAIFSVESIFLLKVDGFRKHSGFLHQKK